MDKRLREALYDGWAVDESGRVYVHKDVISRAIDAATAFLTAEQARTRLDEHRRWCCAKQNHDDCERCAELEALAKGAACAEKEVGGERKGDWTP